MRINDDFVVKKICDTIVVIPINSKLVEEYEPIVMNKDGGYIVQCLEEDISFDELLMKIKEVYPNDDEEELRQVLKAFVNNGIEEGYIC